MPTYLIEHYWPGVTIELLREALDRGQRVMQEMCVEAKHARDTSCMLNPGEEVVFSMHEGPSAAAVRQVNEHIGVLVSRIVEAITVTGYVADLAPYIYAPGV